MDTCTRDTLNELMKTASVDKPKVGRVVKIVRGKHRGKVGVVGWHGLNQHAASARLDWMAAALREASGRLGYRVGIDVDGVRVFVDADNTVVCVD